MNRLPMKQQLVCAFLGTLAAACFLALSVVLPVIAG